MTLQIGNNDYYGRPRKCSGFTLLELLICTAILSTALVMIYRPMLGVLDTIRYADEREEANRLLEREIFEFHQKSARGGVVAPSETRTLLGRDRPFEFRRVAKGLPYGGGLYRLEFQISWKRAGRAKRLIRFMDVYVPQTPTF